LRRRGNTFSTNASADAVFVAQNRDGAGVLLFISIPPNPSAITGNGVDVDLRFGARATFEGVDVGTITCDSTVLSRGTTVCP
jgi:hypothetical protein